MPKSVIEEYRNNKQHKRYAHSWNNKSFFQKLLYHVVYNNNSQLYLKKKKIQTEKNFKGNK